MSPAAVLQVFGQPASTDVARVMACLFERKLAFELVRSDTFKKQAHGNKVPRLVTMKGPRGYVTLKHGDVTLTDSRDICRYVCTEFPRRCTRNLYGAGALERASIEKWLQMEVHSFDAPSSALALYLAFAPRTRAWPAQSYAATPAGKDFNPYHECTAECEARLVQVLDAHDDVLALPSPYANDDEEEENPDAHVAESEAELLRVLDVYDDALDRSAYLAGDEFTLADLCHLPNAHYMACTARGRSLLASRENVAHWYDAISARPAWRQVVSVQARSPHCPFVSDP